MPIKYSVEIDDNGAGDVLKRIEKGAEGVGRAFEGAGTRTQRMSSAMGSALPQMDGMSKRFDEMGRLVNGIGLFMAAKAVGDFTKQAIDNADRLGEMSQALGVGVSQLAGFEYAAKLGGMQTENLHKVLKEVATSAQEAANGTGETAKIYKSLGIEVKDTSGNLKSSGDVLLQLSERFSTMQAGTERTALAVKLFGKQYQEALTFLDQGSAAIRANVSEGERLSGVTEASARAAGEFNDNMDRLTTVMSGFAMSAVSWLQPALERLQLFMQTTSETVNQMRLMNELAQQQERAELRLRLAQVARLQEARKLGLVLNDNQSEYLSRTEKWIQKKNEELGLGEKEIELATKKAHLEARERINRENGGNLEVESYRKRIDELEKQIASASNPTRSRVPAAAVSSSASSKTSKRDPVAEAESRIQSLADAMLSQSDKLNAQYSAELAKLESLDSDHYDRLKETLDAWYAYQVSSMNANESRANAEQAQRDDDERARSVQAAQESARAKMEVYREFYNTDKQNEIHAIHEKAKAFKDAGVDRIDVIKWREEEIAKIEQRYRDEAARKDQEALERQMAIISDRLSKFADAAGKGSQTLANFTAAEENNATQRFDRQKQEVQEYYQQQIEQAQGNEARQEALRKRQADEEARIDLAKEKKLEAIRKKYAAQRKALMIAEAVALSSKAIITLWSDPSLPYMAKVPLAGIEAALLASQVALIKSQKFATGGFPRGRNALVTVNEEGQESILNARATSRFTDVVLAANRGASRDEIADMLRAGRSSAPISISITGVVNEAFVRDSLVPAIEKYQRRR